MSGYNTNSAIAAGTTNATLVVARPSEVHGWNLYNSAAYAVFLKLYNSATIPTAGSGTPAVRIGIPAATAFSISFVDEGIVFSAGLGYTITKLQADNDTTVVVAGDLLVNLFYK